MSEEVTRVYVDINQIVIAKGCTASPHSSSYIIYIIFLQAKLCNIKNGIIIFFDNCMFKEERYCRILFLRQ